MKTIGLLGFLSCMLFFMEPSASSFPMDINQKQSVSSKREPRQTNFHQNPDGSITASFAASQAFKVPGPAGFGGGGAFDVAETINIGPQGATFGGGQSFTSDIGGNRMSSSNANSQNSRFGPYGSSSNGANSNSNSFSNPFFQSSNAQANAFANQFSNNNNFNRF